jgi:hypothetical protein
LKSIFKWSKSGRNNERGCARKGSHVRANFFTYTVFCQFALFSGPHLQAFLTSAVGNPKFHGWSLGCQMYTFSLWGTPGRYWGKKGSFLKKGHFLDIFPNQNQMSLFSPFSLFIYILIPNAVSFNKLVALNNYKKSIAMSMT